MSIEAIVVMVLVCGFVWGGFVLLLVRAIREEGAKASDPIDEHPPHSSP